KGPQAALVMAATSAFLLEAEQAKMSMEDTIEYLNDRLSRLFSQQTATTFSAAALHRDGNVDLYSCGSVGWIKASSREVRHIPQRQSTLGLGERVEPRKMTVQMGPGQTLFSFTDGVLEGSREAKKLVETLEQHNMTRLSPAALFSVACEAG